VELSSEAEPRRVPVRARDNPFRVQRITALSCRLPPGESWEGLLARLAGFGFRAAVVGPEGHGKTTLLRELGRRLAERGFRIRRARLRLRQGRLDREQAESLLADLAADDLLIVDSADQLGWLGRRRLLRASRGAGGLLVASHGAFPLPTLLACRTSPELFAAVLAELVPGAELPPEFTPENLFTRHRGNLREALWELYELWAVPL